MIFCKYSVKLISTKSIKISVLTIENTFECKVHVSVCSLKCIEGDPFSDTADHMYVIGGDMGIITGKSVQNVTLIYPNLVCHLTTSPLFHVKNFLVFAEQSWKMSDHSKLPN